MPPRKPATSKRPARTRPNATASAASQHQAADNTVTQASPIEAVLAELRRLSEGQEQLRQENRALAAQVQHIAGQQGTAEPTAPATTSTLQSTAAPLQGPAAQLPTPQCGGSASLVQQIAGAAFSIPLPGSSIATNQSASAAGFAGLDATAQALATASVSDSTVQAYKRTWTQLHTFCNQKGVALQIPVSESTVARFIASLFEDNYAPSSITSAVSAISFIHKMTKMPDPSESFFIKKMLTGCRKLKGTVDSRLPITLPMLNTIVNASSNTLSSQFNRCRFRAMCTLAFRALLRLGEMTASKNNLQVQDVVLSSQDVQIHFKQYKHSKGTVVRHIPKASTGEELSCAVSSLHQYMVMRGSNPGPLFTLQNGEAVSRGNFATELRAALKFAGYQDEQYTSHSFRIGSATHLAATGASDAQIRHAGRWASGAFNAYIRINKVAE
ncbi:uncharacterized protein [Littorina saxatilis]|uniref:uncharacterized protein n=1 Tax=Littorina saxatilis TaxID=31220 RepID=UPI0038B537D2